MAKLKTFELDIKYFVMKECDGDKGTYCLKEEADQVIQELKLMISNQNELIDELIKNSQKNLVELQKANDRIAELEKIRTTGTITVTAIDMNKLEELKRKADAWDLMTSLRVGVDLEYDEDDGKHYWDVYHENPAFTKTAIVKNDALAAIENLKREE
jgi:hypothetical protein